MALDVCAFLLSDYPGMALLGHRIRVCSIVNLPISLSVSTPMSSRQGFQLLHVLAKAWYLMGFAFHHSGVCMMVSPGGFALHFLMTNELKCLVLCLSGLFL